MANVTHVAVVEADPIYREGLLHVMSGAGFQTAAACSSVEQLLAAPAGDLDRLLILVDFGQEMWNVGTDVASLRRKFPNCKVVILADNGSERFLVQALQAGVDGLLVRPIGCDALVKSLELVMLGERIFPAHFIRVLASETPAAPVHAGEQNRALEKLSARELDVLQELSSGSPNKIIARRFGITEATVKVHVKAILRKISARNRTEAAIWARNYMLTAEHGQPSMPASSPMLLAGKH
jgi:two-component system, NarL family, nitrate/nitrite response regulator NarL